jgi:tellurite resistance protein TerC
MDLLFIVVFLVFIVAILMFDLLFVGKGHHLVKTKEAAIWTAVWVSMALLFFVFVRFGGHYMHGINSMEKLIEVTHKYYPALNLDGMSYEEALKIYQNNTSIDFLSGYLIEQTLSVDNLFVMMMILTAFGVSKRDYKSVLFWGILGAIVLRFAFIFIGSSLIQHFEWVLLIFGGYLVYMGIKMFIHREEDELSDPRNHFMVKFLSKHFNVYPRYVNGRFVIRNRIKLFITPLLIVVMMIEVTDVIFAMDSIPAIFSITRDPYIVFCSNIFAIIGLRSMFFLLAGAIDKFHYLKAGVALLLLFVGLKLLFHTWLDHVGFNSLHSLYVVLAILTASVALSMLFPKKDKEIKA